MTSAPILEFDPAPDAILNPSARRMDAPVPQKAVLCFFQEQLTALAAAGRLKRIGALASEIGPNPLYTLEHAGQTLLVFHPGVGAPLAAGFLEELIALGVNRFVAVGGCGVLDREVAVGHPVVITAAVRDEGTSYHYLPAGREITPSQRVSRALETALQQRNLPYLNGKSWTTDALYRETVARRASRMAEGCLVVEMEASAFFAVAQFRGVEFGQLVYGGDLVEPEGWDRRAWNDRHSDRELLFWVAADACAAL